MTVYGEYTYEGETQFATMIPEEPLIIQRPVIEEPVQEAQAENVFEIPEEIIVRPSEEILQEESVVDMPVQKPAENHPEDEKVREMQKRDEHRAAVIAADAERARSKLKERIRGEKTVHRRSGFEDIFESWVKEKSNDKQYGE